MQAESEAFLKLLESPSPEGGDLGRLAVILDDLACAIHKVPDIFADRAFPDPPGEIGSNYERFRPLAAAAFPQLGLYPVCDPLEVKSAVPGMGDAIDDLADIAGDLSDCLWRLQNNGMDDAAWHWRFTYRAHWGEHLHDLRRVVDIQLARG